MSGFGEDIVEEAGIEIIKDFGWFHLHGVSIAPDGPAPQRKAFSEAILLPRLERALETLNPPPERRAMKRSASFSPQRPDRSLKRTAASIGW